MTVRLWPIVRVAVEYYPAVAATVPIARAAAGRHLRAWRVVPPAVERAELVVAELTANATKIVAGEDVVALRLTHVEGTLTVEVWDGSDTAPVLMRPNADNESVRGLLLVDALRQRWCWFRPPTGGVVVWAQLPARTLPAHYQIQTGGPALPTRTPVPGSGAGYSVFRSADPALLQRVLDGLRGLDGRYQPNSACSRSAR